MIDTSLCCPPGRAPWRSIRIVVPFRIGHDEPAWCAPGSWGIAARWGRTWPMYERDLCRAIVKHIARSLGLDPKKRTRMNMRTSMGYLGYVLIYRGSEPSTEEKRLFNRAKEMAQRVRDVKLQPAKVRS